MVFIPYLGDDATISADRVQYINNSPAQYAQEVVFCLQHRTPLNHDILFEVYHVVWGSEEEFLSSHADLMYIFIEQGLVSHLAKFAFSDDFWRRGDETDIAFTGCEVGTIPGLILPISV